MLFCPLQKNVGWLTAICDGLHPCALLKSALQQNDMKEDILLKRRDSGRLQDAFVGARLCRPAGWCHREAATRTPGCAVTGFEAAAAEGLHRDVTVVSSAARGGVQPRIERRSICSRYRIFTRVLHAMQAIFARTWSNARFQKHARRINRRKKNNSPAPTLKSGCVLTRISGYL